MSPRSAGQSRVGDQAKATLMETAARLRRNRTTRGRLGGQPQVSDSRYAGRLPPTITWGPSATAGFCGARVSIGTTGEVR
jgi:hypothetical protein